MTEKQAIISPVLADLGLKQQPSDKYGGDFKFSVPDAALEALKGKTVVLKSDGSVSVE